MDMVGRSHINYAKWTKAQMTGTNVASHDKRSPRSSSSKTPVQRWCYSLKFVLAHEVIGLTSKDHTHKATGGNISLVLNSIYFLSSSPDVKRLFLLVLIFAVLVSDFVGKWGHKKPFSCFKPLSWIEVLQRGKWEDMCEPMCGVESWQAS